MTNAKEPMDELSTSLHRIGASLLEGLHLRLNLLAVEFTEEQDRVLRIGFTALALVLCVFAAFVCLNLVFLVMFWDTHRLAVTLGLCGLYSLLALTLAIALNRQRQRRTPAFNATRQVMEEDGRSLRGSS